MTEAVECIHVYYSQHRTIQAGWLLQLFIQGAFPSPASLHVLVLDVSQDRKQKIPIFSPVLGVAELRGKSNFVTLHFQLSPSLVTDFR